LEAQRLRKPFENVAQRRAVRDEMDAGGAIAAHDRDALVRKRSHWRQRKEAESASDRDFCDVTHIDKSGHAY
jgi:hypothetical protein